MELLRYSAFTTDPHGGNPAGVVLGAGHLGDDEMLRIAAEIGYSETAFVDDDRLRYFSPLAEVDFCGHATIATAVALAERFGVGPMKFQTNAGEIAVETAVVDGRVTATLTSAPTRSRPATDTELDEVLAALRWDRADLDPAFPPHVAFAGNEHLVLAAGTRERLAKLDYDFESLGDVMSRGGWTTVHLAWAESAEVFHARDPFPPGGVVEDAATGAAAAAFGGYLRKIGRLESGRFTVLQGEDMGRPSVLTVEVDDRPGVRVTGNAVRIH
ncbi:PhzF family phenazine biosynthesis protein [Amycolatopsis sp. NPDC059657]|uniref:PhzF family phenazine biosynthesis protein n=1 Tax=Amycolatopsis sp. NPDC059657 TaxID=3346899 RepID=UPI00366EF26D